MNNQTSFVEMSKEALEALCERAKKKVFELNAKLDKFDEDKYLKLWNTPKWYHRLFKITPKVYTKEDFIKWCKNKPWSEPPFYPHMYAYDVLGIVEELSTACLYSKRHGNPAFVYVNTEHLNTLHTFGKE